MGDREFWQEIFLANIRNGISHEWAIISANEAVDARNKKTPEPTPKPVGLAQ